MTAKDFFDLVVRMRQAQKSWFKTHNYKFLQESKELEKLVDIEIERVQNDGNHQLQFDF
jgi:hypothetical protein